MCALIYRDYLKRMCRLGMLACLAFTMIQAGDFAWAKTRPTQYRASQMNLPLRFEVNQGQFDSRADFMTRGQGYAMYLSSTQMVLDLEKRSMRLEILGADPGAKAITAGELPGKVNYIKGNDPKKWRKNIPTYKRVTYQKIYPGIDLAYYGRQGKLEYDFVVRPGADVSRISLKVHGSERTLINSRGELVLKNPDGEIRFNKPFCYQESNGGKKIVAGKYIRLGNDRIGFSVGDYDTTRTLVIDPVLEYSTYVGGWQTDVGFDIAVDGAGNSYVVGITRSDDFPVTDGSRPREANQEIFVAKMNPDGSDLIYSTYLGGSDDDTGTGIALSVEGYVYITGYTKSHDFPLEMASQPDYGGGNFDAFVAKLGMDGATLIYSTYVGGSGEEFGEDIALGRPGADRAYFVGTTNSEDLPVHNAFMDAPGTCGGDAFTGRLSFAGGVLNADFLSYLGGNRDDKGHGIAVDFGGNVYVAGETSSSDFPTTAFAFQSEPPIPDVCDGDGFVTKFSFEGTSMILLYSTYLGGVGEDKIKGLAVDPFGSAVVTGYTSSIDFPVQDALFDTMLLGGDAFVTKFNGNGSDLRFSTYLGGNHVDEGLAVTVSMSDLTISVTGKTSSDDFFLLNPVQAVNPDPETHGTAFVSHFDWHGDPIFSTYIGGYGHDMGYGVAAGDPGDVYVTGCTTADRDFPVTPGVFQEIHGGLGDGLADYDAFVLKIGPEGAGKYPPGQNPQDQQTYRIPTGKRPVKKEIVLPYPHERVITSKCLKE